MTTKEVADRLVQLCREGKIEDAQKEFFTDETVSIEPNEFMGEKEVKGLEAIKKKGEMFNSMLDGFYGATISDPLVTGDVFAIAWEMDAKMKGHDRMIMKELCVYKVKDGKILSEQFLF